MERGDNNSYQQIQQHFAAQPNNVDELEEDELPKIRQEKIEKGN